MRILADGDLQLIPSSDLAAEMQYCHRELADLRMNGETEGFHHEYLTHRLGKITGELKRRRRLAQFGGPSVPHSGWASAGTLSEIKARVNLVALAGNYVRLAGGHRRVRYCCPIHGDGDDRNASGMLYPDQHRWWCYGCSSGGDCFDWLMAFEAITFRQAVEKLAQLAGIELPLPSSRRKTKEGDQPHVKVTFRH